MKKTHFLPSSLSSVSRLCLLFVTLLSSLSLQAGVVIDDPDAQTLQWDRYLLSSLGSSANAFSLVQVSFEARCTELESATDYDQIFVTPYTGQAMQVAPTVILGQALPTFTIRVNSTDWQEYTYMLQLETPLQQLQLAMMSEVYNPEIRNLRVATVRYESVEIWSETFQRLSGVGTPEAPVNLATEKCRISSAYTDVPGWKYFDMNALYEEGVLKEVPVSACGRPAVLTEMQVGLQTPLIATEGQFSEIQIDFDLHADDISVAPATEECTWLMITYTDQTGSSLSGTGMLCPYNYLSPDGWSHCQLTVNTKGRESFFVRIIPCGYDALYMTNFRVTGTKLVADGGTPDALRPVTQDGTVLPVYDLSGRSRHQMQKGLNIVGGKKILR